MLGIKQNGEWLVGRGYLQGKSNLHVPRPTRGSHRKRAMRKRPGSNRRGANTTDDRGSALLHHFRGLDFPTDHLAREMIIGSMRAAGSSAQGRRSAATSALAPGL